MPEPWKLKLDDDGKVVLQDEKPVYIDPDGKDVALDPPAMYVKIIDLGAENKKHREKNQGLETSLKLFEGIEDVPTWKAEADKAISTVKNFNEKDWLKADKVEKLKADMKLAYEEQELKVKEAFNQQISGLNETLGKKNGQIRSLLIDNKFATSPLFSGTEPKTILPPEIAVTYFGKNFKVEEDDKTGKLKVVAYFNNGDQVYSRQNPGEVAEFDEAIVSIFEAYPGKDKLVRTKGAGAGSQGGIGDGEIGDEDIKRLEKQYAEALKAGDGKSAIALKNKLFALKKAKAAA